MEALTACVVIVVGGSVLAATISTMWTSYSQWKTTLRSRCYVRGRHGRSRGCLRGADFVTDRVYLESNAKANFGAGLSWWFPQSAAAFIERENLPAQVFNNFDEGGLSCGDSGQKYRTISTAGPFLSASKVAAGT
jgi:hypothetical protein